MTVEGVEGVGKSSNIQAITQFLDYYGVEYVSTREPGGTLIAERIRELLLQTGGEVPTEMTELLLVFAARAQHLDTVIRPALQAGKWVICDRFTDATYAYQGAGRGIEKARIAKLEDFVQDDLRPDLTVILDLDPQTGLERARNRGALDRFEQEKLEFFDRVRQGYLDIAAASPDRCLLLDASQDLETVKQALLEKLHAWLEIVD